MKLFNLFHTAHNYITATADKFSDLAHPELNPSTPLAALECALANVLFAALAHVESVIHAARLRIFLEYRLAYKHSMAVNSIYRYLKLTQFNAPRELILNERRMIRGHLLTYLVANNFHQWPKGRQKELFLNHIPGSLKNTVSTTGCRNLLGFTKGLTPIL